MRLPEEDKNEGPSGSVTNQQSLLNTFVREHRPTIHDTYIDDGWSGSSFDHLGFQWMLRDIEAGKVNMIITKDYCAIIGLNQKDLENQGILA